MKFKRLVFLVILAALVWPLAGTNLSKATAVSAPDDGDVFQFVEVEAQCYRKGEEISERNPEERRWYISSVIVQPDNVPTYSLVKQVYSPYFSKNVMDPMEARGIALDYSEQDMRLNGETSYANYGTRAEAETARNEAIEYRKNQSGNIYSFEIDLKNPQGEATSKPKLIYRDKGQPHYEKAK